MAETRPVNIYQKLAEIRKEFHGLQIEKSGRNNHAEFLYFELSDFVREATQIMAKHKTSFVVTCENDNVVGTLMSWESDGGFINFTIPMRHIAEPAKFRMNEAQATGAELTYYRRYAFYMLLDFSNADEFDSGNVRPVQATVAKEEKPAPALAVVPVPKTEKKKPATPAERAEIKKELTGAASEAQVAGLREALSELLNKDPSQEEFVQTIAVKTNAFRELTAEQCAQLIAGVSEMLTHYEG